MQTAQLKRGIRLVPREHAYLHVIERERRAGLETGPFWRSLMLLGAPAHVLESLDRAAERPDLVGVNQSIQAPLVPQGAATGSFTAIASTVTETNLYNPQLWAPIAPMDMIPGKKYVVEGGGVCGTTGTPVISMRARCGTNNSAPPTGVDLGVSPTMTLGTFTAQPFYFYFALIVRSAGVAASSTTVTGNGYAIFPGAAAATTTPVLSFGGAVPTTVDGTVQQGIGISAIWGTSSASNTMTCQWVHGSSV